MKNTTFFAAVMPKASLLETIKSRLLAVYDGITAPPKPEIEDIFRDPSPEKRKAFIAELQTWNKYDDEGMGE
jgi:hypothetical protein